MDSFEEDYYRSYLVSLCRKLRCSPEDLTNLYSFGSDLNLVFKRLVYENEEA